MTRASSPSSLADSACSPLERRPGAAWWLALLAALGALGLGVGAAAWTLRRGLGTWGLSTSIPWALEVTGFVFWIGIAHAGTLVSALLTLGRRIRGAVSRAAETMAVVALCCAAFLPILHLGRPWLAFWNLPYPNSRGPLWVNFSSPLVWDFFAIATYLGVSILLWYVGLIPDFGRLRERARSRGRRALYAILALGWDGSATAWRRQRSASRALALLAVPVFLLTACIVASDFAVTTLPGWDSALLYPYFIAGALFSGLALLLGGCVVLRRSLKLERLVTAKHLGALAKAVAALGCAMAALYLLEAGLAWASGDPHQLALLRHRTTGDAGTVYVLMLILNLGGSQVLWWGPARRSPAALLASALAITAGMWLERWVIVVSSLKRGFLSSTWTEYAPTIADVGIAVGGFGLFATALLLLGRVVPLVALSEIDAPADDEPITEAASGAPAEAA